MFPRHAFVLLRFFYTPYVRRDYICVFFEHTGGDPHPFGASATGTFVSQRCRTRRRMSVCLGSTWGVSSSSDHGSSWDARIGVWHLATSPFLTTKTRLKYGEELLTSADASYSVEEEMYQSESHTGQDSDHVNLKAQPQPQRYSAIQSGCLYCFPVKLKGLRARLFFVTELTYFFVFSRVGLCDTSLLCRSAVFFSAMHDANKCMCAFQPQRLRSSLMREIFPRRACLTRTCVSCVSCLSCVSCVSCLSRRRRTRSRMSVLFRSAWCVSRSSCSGTRCPMYAR